MKNLLFILMTLITTTSLFSQKKSFYDFQAKNIQGQDVNMNIYKGKKILVMNVASECGYTPQYKELEELYQQYKDSGLIILGFPCNDFGGQEPGTESEIINFCQKNYGVTFPLMLKISTKDNACHPIFSWLQHKAENGVQEAVVSWNFNKFMINTDGSWGGYLPSKVKPNDPVIINWIKK